MQALQVKQVLVAVPFLFSVTTSFFSNIDYKITQILAEDI